MARLYVDKLLGREDRHFLRMYTTPDQPSELERIVLGDKETATFTIPPQEILADINVLTNFRDALQNEFLGGMDNHSSSGYWRDTLGEGGWMVETVVTTKEEKKQEEPKKQKKKSK